MYYLRPILLVAWLAKLIKWVHWFQRHSSANLNWEQSTPAGGVLQEWEATRDIILSNRAYYLDGESFLQHTGLHSVINSSCDLPGARFTSALFYFFPFPSAYVGSNCVRRKFSSKHRSDKEEQPKQTDQFHGNLEDDNKRKEWQYDTWWYCPCLKYWIGRQ